MYTENQTTIVNDNEVMKSTAMLTSDELAEAKNLIQREAAKASYLKSVIDAYDWSNDKDYKMSRVLNNIRAILSELTRELVRGIEG